MHKRKGQRKYSLPEPTPVELAYMAGFFDGEGCITVHRFESPNVKNRGLLLKLTVKVGQMDPAPLLLFARFFGGKIVARPIASGKIFHVWSVGDIRAGLCVEKLAPFLIVKKEEASIALKFRGIGHGYGFSRLSAEKVSELRLECFERLRSIKADRGRE